MKLRVAKKLAKHSIRHYGVKIEKIVGRTFYVSDHSALICERWYAYTIWNPHHPLADSTPPPESPLN